MPQRLDQIIQAAKSPGSLTPAPMRASQLSPVAREVFGASLEGERARDADAARQQRLVEQETARRRAARQEKRRTRGEETQKAATWINDSAVSAYASAVDRPTMKGPDGRLMPADSEEDWNRTLQTRQADIAKEEATKRAKELETAKAEKLTAITNEEKTLGHRLTDPALQTLSDTEREKKRVAADEARLSATMTLLPEVEKRIETRYAGDKEATRSALEAARMGQADPEILAEIERDMPEHFAGERTLRDELGRDEEIRKQRDDLEKQRFSVSGKALELSQRDPLAAATEIEAPQDRFAAERVKLEFEQRQSELAARAEDIATRSQGLQANHEATVAQINAEYQAALSGRLTQPEVAVLTAKRNAALLSARANLERGSLDLTREQARIKIEADEFNRSVEALNRPRPAGNESGASVVESVETPEGPRESVVIDRESADMASSLDEATASGRDLYLRPSGVSVEPLDEATVIATTEKAKRLAESAATRTEEEMKPLLAAMASGSMTEEEARAKGEEKQRTVLASVHEEISAVANETLTATMDGKLSVGQYRTIMKELGYPPAAADEVLKEVTTRETEAEKLSSGLQAIYAKEDLKHKDLATSSTRRSREKADRITGKEGAPGVGRVIVDHTMPVVALINLFRDSRDDEKKAGRVAAKRADLKTSLDTAMTNREAEASALLAQYPSISDEDATRLKLSAANNALRESAKGFEEIMAGAVEAPEKYLPFVGDYVGLALELSPVIEAAHKVRNGEELTGTDEFFLQSFIDESGRDMTALGIAAEIVAQMPAFAVEIGTTGGVGSVVRKGLGAATTKIVGKELMESVAKWGASRGAKSRLIGRGARSVLDTTLATPLAMQDFIVANTIRRMELPELEDFTGDAHAWIAEPGVGFGEAVLASGFDAWKEMVSETAGGAVGMIGNATMNRLAKASWVQAARKLNNSVPVAAISKLGRRAQIHGPLTELAEERIGDLIGATGHALSGGMVGEEFQWPSPTQWAGEAIGMMVPGAVFAVANHRATKAAIRENRASFEAAHGLIDINWTDPTAAVDGINGLLTGSGVPVSPITADELSAIESQIGPLAELPAVRRSREIEERLGGFMEDAEARDDLETLGRATSARLSGTYQQTKRAVDTILTHRAVAQHAGALAEMGDLESAALATGAAKLAAGRPLAELTTAERTVLQPQPVALPDGTVQPAPLLVEEVNGVPVVTDAGKSAVAQVLGANLTDALLPMNEAKARRKALNPVPVWKPSSSSSASSPSDSASRSPAPSSGSATPSPGTTTTTRRTEWVGTGEKGTVVRIPGDAASSLDEAERQLAGMLPLGEMLADTAPPSMGGQESRVTREEEDADDIPGLRPLDGAREKLQQIVDDAKLSEQQRKKGEFVLSVLERIGATGILPSEKIEFTTDTKDGPMGIAHGGILRINLELLDKHTNKGLDHFGGAVIEEFIHAVAVQKLDPGLVAQTWQNLPLNLKNYVLGAYTYRADADALTPPANLDDFQLGHEFLRMVIQDRAFQGKVTEAMAENPGFAAEVRELLRQLVEALRSLVASLPSESRGQVETQVNIVIDALREMGVEVGGERVANQNQSTREATTTGEANPSILTPLTDWIGGGTVADIGPVFLAMNPGFPGHDKGLHRWIRKQVGGDAYDASSDQEKFESVAEAILSGKYRARLQPGPLAELFRQYRSEVPEGTESLDRVLPPASQAKPPSGGSSGINPLTDAADAPKIVGTGEQTETPTREPRLLGSTGTAYTSTGEPVEFQWAIVEAGDTITSHGDSLAANPEYDQSLQGRNRDSAASAASIADIEKNTTFNRLSDSSETSSGAPIVGPDLVVESGNGRSIALRRAYRKKLPNSRIYKSDLVDAAARYGFTPGEVEALAQPVLVRIRRSEVDRAAFAEDANRPVVAQMSAKETALADAKGLPASVLEQLEVTADGDLYTPQNLAFFQRFFRLRVSPGELPGLVGIDGRLSRPGLDRVRNAVFVAAYGSDARAMRLFDRLAEEIDPDQRNIVNALLAAGPSLARYRAGVESGSRHATPLPEDLLSAADEFIQSRAEGHTTEEWLGQQRMFDEITPPQAALIRFMDGNTRSAKRLSAGFRNVITLLERAGNPSETDMFGEQGSVDYQTLLGRGIETAELIGSETQGEMALGMGTDSPRKQFLNRVIARLRSLGKSTEKAERALAAETAQEDTTPPVKPYGLPRNPPRTDLQYEGDERTSLDDDHTRGSDQRDTGSTGSGGPIALAKVAGGSHREQALALAGGFPLGQRARRILAESPRLFRGEEHSVRLDPEAGRVIKVTRADVYGAARDNSPSGYLERLLAQNNQFGDNIRFLGALEVSGGVVLVTDQPYYDGAEPTNTEVEEWFAGRGYVSVGVGAYYDGRTVINDAVPRNVKKMADGSMMPFDVIARDASERESERLDNILEAEKRDPESVYSKVQAGRPALGMGAARFEAEQFDLFDYRAPDGGIRRIPRTKPAANSQGPTATLIFQGNLFDGVAGQEPAPETPETGRGLNTVEYSPYQDQTDDGSVAASPEPPAALASRSRPRERVSFGRDGQGITGPSGSKLLGYSWAWTLEESVDNRGEDVVRRVSDWEKSAQSEETGREIVHQFEVETPNGEVQTMSLESATKALGFGSANGADVVAMKRAGNAAKNYAKAKMRLDRLESFAADVENWNREFEARKSEIATSTVPEPVIEWSEADRVYNITLGDVNVGWRLPSQSAKVESGEWLREISSHERDNWRDQWRTAQVMGEMSRPQPVAGPGIPYDLYAGIQSARKAVERNEKLMRDSGGTVDAPETDSPDPTIGVLRMGVASNSRNTPDQLWFDFTEQTPAPRPAPDPVLSAPLADVEVPDVLPSLESPATGHAIEADARKSLRDFGEKIGGARKDLATKSPSKKRERSESTVEPWRKGWVVTEILAGPDTGRWSFMKEEKRSSFWSSFSGRNEPSFATEEEAEAALPARIVIDKHRVSEERDVENKPVPDKWAIYRQVSNRKRAPVKRGFDSKEEALG